MLLHKLKCVSLGIAAGFCMAVTTAKGADATWNVDVAGNWTDDTKWTAAHPNGVNEVANLTFDLTVNRIVTLNAPITIGTLNLGDPGATFRSYTISGTETLTFEVTTGNAQIGKSSGITDIINVPVLLNDNLDVTFPSLFGNITINGAISGNSGIQRLGGDAGALGQRLILGNAANSYAGDTVMTQGTLRVTPLTGAIPDGAGKGNVFVDANGGFELIGAAAGQVETINGLSGSGHIDNASNNTHATLAVGNNDATSEFSGVIKNTGSAGGLLRLSKIGAGTLTLSGANSYGGTTTVSGGTLLVNGTHFPTSTLLVEGTYTVTNGATLGGVGNIDAGVVYRNGGIVSPGTSSGSSSIGTLTINELLSVNPVSGDYNGDSVVNAADFTVWRDTLGDSTNLVANGNNTGASVNLIDQADYVVWKGGFGGTDKGTLAIDIDESNVAIKDLLVVEGLLDVSKMSLAFDVTGSLTQPNYVFASYSSLTGTFASANLPAGYTLDYNFAFANQIALVGTVVGSNVSTSVPEPTSLVLLCLGLVGIANTGRRFAANRGR